MPRFAYAFVLILFVSLAATLPQSISADEDGKAPSMKPVEDDVHEFMEYAFEPFFHALKESLAEAPKDKQAWNPIKAHALILAENGNLLMLRGPEEERAEWNKLAADLREQGQLLYQSSKKRDYQAARKHYESFVTKCNACHTKFAEGEHIQKP